MALAASAQDNIEEWFENGRPEHYETVTIDENGVHRAPRRIGSQATAPLKAKGTQKVPVILVAFADKAFTTADSTDAGVNAFYDKFCNGTMDGKLYTGHGSHGAIRDYFVEQSDSVFFPEFVIIGPVTLDNGYATYGKNGSSKDTGFGTFRNEAIAKAQAVYTGSWSDFDNDGNGTVDMVFFIYAGLGENNNQTDTNLIWPKESTTAVSINGTVYSCSGATCELRPKSRDEDGNITATKTDGVGVFIHELSHALGLPDFYDTQNKAFGMDLWSVMDYGEYGNNGYNPGNYTAYERDFMGWRPLIDLTEPCVLTIPCFADGGYGYRIYNDADSSEYYVIENRQAKGWDDRICRLGHGLQVTHVDYLASRWNGNYVNTDPTHQRMTIIAANNNYNGTNVAQTSAQWLECLEGNLFPGSDLVYLLTDDSDPAAKVYTGEFMHKPIVNITENEDSTITLCYRTNGQLEAPVVNEAENVEMTSFTASWQTVENATNYVCELYRDSLLISSDTLTDTSIEYTDLAASSALKYRVKAFADTPEDYIPSEWSDYAYLTTLVDLITNIDDSEKHVTIYNLSGMLVSRSYADELERLSLRKGVYVVKYSNGATKKVIIK